MMNIQFKDDEILFQQMQEEWNKIEDAFFLDHYELAKQNHFSPLAWRQFLTNAQVADWMTIETRLIEQSRVRMLLKDLDVNSRSTGLPQLLNTLTTHIDKREAKSNGPIFIYMHVPLNEEEKYASNISTPEINSIDDITDI
jgi:hypothetical protein